MLLAAAALFFQFVPVPHSLSPAEPAPPRAEAAAAYQPGRLTPEPVAAAGDGILEAPAPGHFEDARADLLTMQERSEARAHRGAWLVLSVAQHGAATFDAWSTRRAVSSGHGRETNPLLRPFAGNASIYAVIQGGPVALNYLGRRMLTSRHGWARKTWWLPQAAGIAVSIASGVHNLRVSNASASP